MKQWFKNNYVGIASIVLAVIFFTWQQMWSNASRSPELEVVIEYDFSYAAMSDLFALPVTVHYHDNLDLTGAGAKVDKLFATAVTIRNIGDKPLVWRDDVLSPLELTFDDKTTKILDIRDVPFKPTNDDRWLKTTIFEKNKVRIETDLLNAQDSLSVLIVRDGTRDSNIEAKARIVGQNRLNVVKGTKQAELPAFASNLLLLQRSIALVIAVWILFASRCILKNSWQWCIGMTIWGAAFSTSLSTFATIWTLKIFGLETIYFTWHSAFIFTLYCILTLVTMTWISAGGEAAWMSLFAPKSMWRLANGKTYAIYLMFIDDTESLSNKGYFFRWVLRIIYSDRYLRLRSITHAEAKANSVGADKDQHNASIGATYGPPERPNDDLTLL